MAQRHTAARSPSVSPNRLRANWHRRMALASLRGNSSKAVRLARYRAHIEKARTLEADLLRRFEAVAYFEQPSTDVGFDVRLVPVSLGLFPSHAEALNLCMAQLGHPDFAGFRVVCVEGGAE